MLKLLRNYKSIKEMAKILMILQTLFMTDVVTSLAGSEFNLTNGKLIMPILDHKNV